MTVFVTSLCSKRDIIKPMTMEVWVLHPSCHNSKGEILIPDTEVFLSPEYVPVS